MIELIKFPIRAVVWTALFAVTAPLVIIYWLCLLIGDLVDWAFEGHI